jgi:MoxR-like ATPase
MNLPFNGDQMNDNQIKLIEALTAKGYSDEIDRKTLIEVGREIGVSTTWLEKNDTFKVSRGVYKIPKLDQELSQKPVTPKNSDRSDNIVPIRDNMVSFVPPVDQMFVRFGQYKDIESIIKSQIFYPVFVTGLSGNGKTFMIEQACAKLKREMFRVNITVETDEDDLLGHYALKNGETVWQDGPVIQAMERGAVLLLDEVDLASNKILCLQPVLEGKGVFIKKINRWVRPADGFNVLATANTKGKGSDDGRFIGTNILNEAFLERFAITVEQEYPSVSVEKRILRNVFTSLNISDDDYIDKLVNWADIIRKTFYDGGIDEIIATRRLVHIANAFAIFNDRMKAIQMCVNRFDDETKTAFLDLYSKVDADVNYNPDGSAEGGESTADTNSEDTKSEEIVFGTV